MAYCIIHCMLDEGAIRCTNHEVEPLHPFLVAHLAAYLVAYSVAVVIHWPSHFEVLLLDCKDHSGHSQLARLRCDERVPVVFHHGTSIHCVKPIARLDVVLPSCGRARKALRRNMVMQYWSKI